MNHDSMASAIYPLLRNAHLFFGAIALVTFWLQIARRKGGTPHRGVGWVYLAAMIGVLATAVPMTVFIWRSGQPEMALFLGFLTVISCCAGLEALLASRNRSSGAWLHGPTMIACTGLIFFYSLLLVVLFARTRMVLLLVMATLGVAATVETVVHWRTNRPYRWVEHHLDGMLATGIAVHIAFFSFGLRRWFEGQFTLWAFVLPLVIGHLMSVYFRRSLRRAAATARDLTNEHAEDGVRSL